MVMENLMAGEFSQNCIIELAFVLERSLNECGGPK
jgi:hypothetical protein